MIIDTSLHTGRLEQLISIIKEEVKYENVKNVMYYAGIAEGILEIIACRDNEDYFNGDIWQKKINEAMGDYY